MKEIIFFCDRCGKRIYRTYELKTSFIKVMDYDVGPDFKTLYLCKTCLNHFYNFMRKKVLSYNDISKED